MNGKDFAVLLSFAEKLDKKGQIFLKKELANQLDINVKTLEGWVSNPQKSLCKIGRPYVAYMRRIFEPFLLLERIRSLEEKVFKIIPSEYIGFWLVCGTEVVLLKDSVRNELLKPQKKYKFFNDEIHKRLSDVSMTIDAIQSAKVINTSGESISQHKKKTIPHVMATSLSEGKCFSMVKIPLITASAIGPRVVGLLDIQNKLEKTADNQYQQIHPDAHSSIVALYSQEEIDLIRETAHKEYTQAMKEIMDALDYLDPHSSPVYFA